MPIPATEVASAYPVRITRCFRAEGDLADAGGDKDELGADAAHLFLGHAGVDAPGSDQVVDLVGREAVDKGASITTTALRLGRCASGAPATGGKKLPRRSLGMASSTSPAWWTAAGTGCPLRWVVRWSARSTEDNTSSQRPSAPVGHGALRFMDGTVR